ncbi:MAG: glutamate mutase L [Ardenticatenales bacterium]|nr:glutamate mutase L [Ardenticatenales bacterium]
MQSTLQRVTDSLLAADVGSMWTRVLLIDRVEGEYRFIARGDVPTTLEPPYSDIAEGVRAAIREIEANTGRQLLEDDGDLITPEGVDGRGVDLFLVSSSAAPPLRVAVGGLVGRVSAASARRAALSIYADIIHTFSLDSPLGRWGHPREALGVVEQLLTNWPDAIVLAGGIEGSSDQDLLELVDAVGLVLESSPERAAPTLIYAGNSDRQDDIQERLANVPLMITENIRPTLADERLRTVGRLLEQQFRARHLSRLPGVERLRSWGNNEIIPTVEAFARVIQYMALSQDKRVLGVDLGAANASLAVTFPNRVAQTLVRTDLGIARDPEALIQKIGAEALATWVPGFSTPQELVTHLMNLLLYPAQQPMTRETLLLLQGVAREVLRLLIQDASGAWPTHYPGLLPPFDIILGSGTVIREAPRPAQALSIMLDAIQPIGITHFLRDHVSLAPTIGALADFAPHISASLVDAQGFESLGLVIAPVGVAQPGDEILRFRLTQADGITEGTVEYGQLYRFATTHQTLLELRPLRGFDLGLGPGVGAEFSRVGDLVGFVIDARGRPLAFPSNLQARRRRVEEWLLYVGA